MAVCNITFMLYLSLVFWWMKFCHFHFVFFWQLFFLYVARLHCNNVIFGYNFFTFISCWLFPFKQSWLLLLWLFPIVKKSLLPVFSAPMQFVFSRKRIVFFNLNSDFLFIHICQLLCLFLGSLLYARGNPCWKTWHFHITVAFEIWFESVIATSHTFIGFFIFNWLLARVEVQPWNKKIQLPIFGQ